MNRNLLTYVSLFLTLTFSCVNSGSFNVAATNPADNYKISWGPDSNFVFLKNCTSKSIQLIPYASGSLFIDAPVGEKNRTGILVSADSPKGLLHDSATVTKKGPLFPTNAPHYDSLGIDLSKHLSGFTYGTQKSPPKTVDLAYIAADKLECVQHDSLILGSFNCRFKNIGIVSDRYLAGHPKNDTVQEILYPLNLDIGSSSDLAPSVIPQTDTLSIDHVVLGDILPGNTPNVIINNCYVSGTHPNVDCTDIGGLRLSRLTFKDQQTQLYLDGDKALTGRDVSVDNQKRKLKKRLDLDMDVKDVGHLHFDYQYFTFVEKDNYLTSKKFYSEIISTQKLQAYQEGLLAALIDSSEYEDKQHPITALFIPLKLWWNNYGYDREKVLSSIFQLFIFVWMINYFLFSSLLETYPFEGIKKRYHQTASHPNQLKKNTVNLALSFIYSGYLFFGLKFEVDKLELKSIQRALWVITQYALGIISLAYLANLILSR